MWVSIPSANSFGIYRNGDKIPSAGKTNKEVIEMALNQPLPPTLTLSSNTTIPFGTADISNSLSFSKTINSRSISGDMAVATASTLMFNRTGTNSVTWTNVLNPDLSTINLTQTSIVHNLNSVGNTLSPYYYRYYVEDSAYGTNSVYLVLTPESYIAPTASIVVSAGSSVLPETITGTSREKGNIASTITGTIYKNTTLAPMQNYYLQYQKNGSGSFIDISATFTDVSGSTQQSSYSYTFTHNNTSLKDATSIKYRLVFTDNQISTQVDSTAINFYNMIFYGVTSSTVIDSPGVRSLGNATSGNINITEQYQPANTRIFLPTSSASLFTLNTGTTYLNLPSYKYIFAIPATKSASTISDTTVNGPIQVSTFNQTTVSVQDAGGTSINYKVYTFPVTAQYTDKNHTWVVNIQNA